MSNGARLGNPNLPNSKGESLTDLLARRPELRDVGIAGYLAGAAVDGAPGMPKTKVRWYLRSVSVQAWEVAA